ncbi:grasp-with-spasm system ATP-grasp peptide maturase [Taibaiella chishuiensis]|uniref:ATP-GRASP peptide maturase of grasp-with-spasm system n=1 Tax=Taibaiella chishuiensis TaxID=1434707 RepID=A0A2P8D0C2_9BACT|nr:grasp-with-spasm system ATP-grasp peptide maturase [Taibaiella chishuiensis]PSK90668.1 ATP-GRASP peptide maturase of grasp-with-spasm system [Taibaiella chishuiensis]
MIAIQSHSDEASTDDVIDWLLYLGADRIKRLNGNVSLNKETLRINNDSGHSSLFGELQAYWYRRGYFTLDIPDTGNPYPAVTTYFEKEYEYYTNGTAHFLSKQHSINSFCDNHTNKITNLVEAARAGLLIPDTLITADVKEIKAFAALYPRIITKAIAHNRIAATIDSDTYINIAVDTAIFDRDMIDALSAEQHFLPAVFQEYLEKKYELRIFYFHGRLYSMAIFSQLNEATRIDFRKHDRETPNRCVPYQLPDDLENKLRSFMQRIAMNSGSIDMVVTPSDDYVFLEVNPVGQLQWLSGNCNYPVEREIAKFLLHDQETGNRTTENHR